MTDRIILHIGTEKTGSTSIQSGIKQNKCLLKDNNIYPVLPTPSFFRGAGEKLVSIKSASRQFPRKSDVLISSELFQSRLKTEQELVTLKKALLKTFPQRKDIVVIVYLRRQAAIANSMVSTAAMYDVDFKQSPLSQYVRTICNHQKTLSIWSNVFGEDQVKPKLFEPGNSNRDFFRDFVGTFCAAPKDLVEPDLRNPSLSHDGVLIARAVHNYIKCLVKEGRVSADLARKTGAQIVKRKLAKIDQGSKFMLHPAVWELYDNEYMQMNKNIRNLYFPEASQEFLFDLNIRHNSPSEPSITESYAEDQAIKLAEEYLAEQD